MGIWYQHAIAVVKSKRILPLCTKIFFSCSLLYFLSELWSREHRMMTSSLAGTCTNYEQNRRRKLRNAWLKWCSSLQPLPAKVVVLLAFQNLGVVYGDLGTSPLYVFRSTFPHGFQDQFHEVDVLGALSLVIYTIALIPLLKYMFIVLNADDNGEGQSNWPPHAFTEVKLRKHSSWSINFSLAQTSFFVLWP
jgi:hypothetical protein